MNHFLQRLLPLLCCLVLFPYAAAAQSFPFHLDKGAGTFRLGVACGEESRWLDECAVSKDGASYLIKDKLFKGGHIRLTIHPLTTNGFIAEVAGDRLPEELQLCWAFGACDGVERSPANQLIPTASCFHNVHSIEGNAFTTYYGASMRLRVTQGVAPLRSELRLADGHQQSSPLTLYDSGKKTDAPVIAALTPWRKGEKLYFCIYQRADYNYYMLPSVFHEAQKRATK